MRILANENFPGPVVRALRALGHDVLWVRDYAPGSSDIDVLARASAEGRVVATLDRDFGQLAFQARLPATCGVLLVRLRPRSLREDNQRMVDAIHSMPDIEGVFAVVEEDRIRLRRIPRDA